MSHFISILAVIATFAISTSHAIKAVKVAAFNVQVFGQTKIAKNNVVHILAKIINRYDIILIQEIRDVGNKKGAMEILLENVNKLSQSSQYDMEISGRLGRSASKEQYAFLYRKSIASVKESYTYVDKKDDFEREPFVVRFKVPTAGVSDMVFIAIHTKPDHAAHEVDKLVEVYNDAVKKWGIKNVVIMGDMNAACNYVKDADWKNISLATDKRFWWLIDDCQDTSVQGSRCAYDRFVATGDDMLKNIVPESAGLFDFKSAYHLNMQEASSVSDHFPIEFQVKHQGWDEVETMSYVLRSVLPRKQKKGVYGAARQQLPSYKKMILYKKSGGMNTVAFKATTTNIRSAISSVQMLHTKFSNLMGDIQSDLAVMYLKRLESGARSYPYQVISEYRNIVDVKIEIQLIWNIAELPVTCSLEISKSI